MDSISLTTLAAVVGIMGFLYTYIKDRVDMGRAFGKLEQRVEALNKLLRDGRVLMFQKGSKLLYKLGRPQDAKWVWQQLRAPAASAAALATPAE